MFTLLSLLLAAPFGSLHATTTRSSHPFESDRALLLGVSRACHVHDGAVYFIQHSRLGAPTIHTTAALGDTDAQITCVLQSLPAEFVARYGLDGEEPANVQRRTTRAAQKRIGVARYSRSSTVVRPARRRANVR